jgi:hypothetical protein
MEGFKARKVIGMEERGSTFTECSLTPERINAVSESN